MNTNYALLLVGIPLTTAFLLPIVGLAGKKLARWIAFAALAFNFVYSLGLLLYVNSAGPAVAVIGNWKPPFGINFYLSPLSLFFATTIYFVGMIVALYRIGAETIPGDEKLSTAILLTVMAAGAVVLTGDIFNMFVFLEILSIGTVILVASRGAGISFRGAFKYIVFAGIGTGALLFAIGFAYGTLGTLNMAEIGLRVTEINFAVAGFIALMFAAGLLVEAEIFPFNLWLPDAYEGSFAHINALLSGVVGTAGVYATARIFLTLLGIKVSDYVMFYGKFNFNNILIVLGVLTVLLGEIAALTQKNIKKILAYSSAAQMGIVLFAIGIGTHTALAGGVFHLFNHAVSKALLFVAASMMIHKAGTADIDELAGLGRKSRTLALLFGVGAFGVIGIPMFNGFWSKMYVVKAAVERGGWNFLAVAVILGAALAEVFYYFRILFKLFNPVDIEIKNRGNLAGYLAIFALAAVILWVGINPSGLGGIINSAAGELFDKSTYISTVLGTGVLQ